MRILSKPEGAMKLWIDPAKCTGCLRCELACSFHHSRHISFQPERSSLRVNRSNVDRSIRIAFGDSCDGCAGERFALCVRACVFNALGVHKEAA